MQMEIIWIHKTWWKEDLKPALALAGIDSISFHDLRHTCATAMIAKGVDNKTVQTRLGHSSIQTTMNIYAHCLPSMNKNAGDKLDVLFD